jgi:hypothetical protein
MNPTVNARRINLFEAVKYDIRLHGSRFIILEFALVGFGALALAVVELVHSIRGGLPLLGGLYFLSFALNCLAVVLLALRVKRTGTGTVYGDRRLHLYALQLIVMLLIPLAVLLAALAQLRQEDSQPAFASGDAKENT